MNKLSQTSYRALFLKHVYRFLGNVSTPKELLGRHVIAVSGGLDSMALLWFAWTLRQQDKIGPIRVIFVHHHTRPGQDYDAQIIKDFCTEREISFEILHAEGLNALMSNFENRARSIRRQLLLENLKDKEKLWLAHHLDDSYEWSMMQRSRSSQPKSTLGIPVRNGSIIRPFLCVTKAQIRQLSRFEKIIYREDPSNVDTRFDRNYLREEVIPRLARRYPHYLKHYAYNSNYLAMILHLNITHRINGNQIYVYDQGAVIQGTHHSQYQIQELLHTYSNGIRGEITSQISKMLKAIDNDKKGPFQFSGGTEVYYSHQLMMIYTKGMKNNDEAIAKVLSSITAEEFDSLPSFTWKDLERNWTNFLKTPDAMLNMPGLVLILQNGSVGKTLNASVYDSLFPLVSEVAKQRGFFFITTLKCLDYWKKKKNKLPEKLKLLPLWTLTNLSSSQE